MILFEKITAIKRTRFPEHRANRCDRETRLSGTHPFRVDDGLTKSARPRDRDAVETGPSIPTSAPRRGQPESEIIPVTRANGITVGDDAGAESSAGVPPRSNPTAGRGNDAEGPGRDIVNWPSMTINRAWWERRTEEEQRRRGRNSRRAEECLPRRARLWSQRSPARRERAHHDTDLRWEAMIPVLKRNVPVPERPDLAQIRGCGLADREKTGPSSWADTTWRAADS